MKVDIFENAAISIISFSPRSFLIFNHMMDLKVS